MPGYDDDTPEEVWEYCDRCGDELTGDAHYHCGNCNSTEETTFQGHLYGDFRTYDGKYEILGEPYWHCREEDNPVER